VLSREGSGRDGWFAAQAAVRRDDGRLLQFAGTSTPPDVVSCVRWPSDAAVPRDLGGAGDQLGHGRKLAFLHRRLQIRPGNPLRASLAPPNLGEEDIPFNAKRGKILFERAHPLPDAGHPSLELGKIE